MEWYIGVLKKYAVFEGRAQRKEYWMFVLFNIIISIGVGIIDGLLNLTYSITSGEEMGVLGGLYSLAIIIPSFSVGARRLHDINKSGWWQLLVFIPIIGWLILIYFAVQEGHAGSNRFGDNPKEGDASNAPQTQQAQMDTPQPAVTVAPAAPATPTTPAAPENTENQNQ